jgi:hypothetical protein
MIKLIKNGNRVMDHKVKQAVDVAEISDHAPCSPPQSWRQTSRSTVIKMVRITAPKPTEINATGTTAPGKRRGHVQARLWRLVLMLLLGGGLCPLRAQDQDPKFIALFITNFAKYVEWPAPNDSGDFVITVVGDNQVSNELKIMAEKTAVGNMRLKILSCSNVKDIGKSRIVYLATSRSDLLKETISKCCTDHTLIVTNKTGLGRAGAAINLLNAYWKQRYEINIQNLQQCGLSAKPVLFKLGVMIGP